MKYKMTVTATCVACGTTKEIKPNEIADGDMPMCPICYSVMIAESAKAEKEG